MVDLNDVIEIYRSYGVEISEADAAEELTHASAGGADYSTVVFRINCYAREESRVRDADACDVEEREPDDE